MDAVLAAREAAHAYRATSLEASRSHDGDDLVGASIGHADPALAGVEDRGEVER